MAEPVMSNTGLIFSISAAIPATFDEAGYGATAITWTEIGEVETMGPYGVTRQIIEFTPVKTGVVSKMGGSKNYGNIEGTCGKVSDDGGQILARAATEANTHYSLRVEYPDPDEGGIGEVHYLDVIATKFEYAGGGANDVAKVNLGFAVSRAPVIVTPA